MKIVKNKNNNKMILGIISGVIILAIAGLLVYIFTFNGSLFGWPHRNDPNTTEINLNPPTKEQVKDSQDTKQQTVNRDQTTKQAPATTTPIPVSISASNKTSTLFQVRALIDDLVSDGTCTIVLTKDSATVTKTAKTLLLASTSTCDGFDIPLSELSSGSWTYAVTVLNNTTNRSGKAAGTISV